MSKTRIGRCTSATIKIQQNVRRRPKSGMSDHLPKVGIGVSLTAVSVSLSVRCRQSEGEGGRTLTSEPMSIRKRVRVIITYCAWPVTSITISHQPPCFPVSSRKVLYTFGRWHQTTSRGHLEVGWGVGCLREGGS